jgi:hypothetical protein
MKGRRARSIIAAVAVGSFNEPLCNHGSAE